MKNTSPQIDKRTPLKQGNGCLTLFGLLFFLVGVGIFVFSLIPVYKSWQAKDWIRVDARIEHVEQTISRGEDSTTYGVKGTFSYQYNGNKYYSNQLNFLTANDNVGDYQQDFYRRLSNIKTSKQTITAFVNSAVPQQAVIDKGVRWEMLGFSSIFLLAFGGAGLVIIFAGRWAKKKAEKEAVLRGQYPQQPWLWKKEWQQESIASDSKGGILGIAVFATLWNLIAFPVGTMVLFKYPQEKDPVLLIALIFPLIGIGLIAWALLLFIRHKKFGSSQLFLNKGRVEIGKHLKGQIEVDSNNLSRDSQAIISLSCINRYTSGSGKNRKTREKIIWQDDCRASVNGMAFDFVFKVPENLPEFDQSNKKDQTIWRLSLHSAQPGADLKLNFSVPAFKAKQSEIENDSEILPKDKYDLFAKESSQPASNTNREYLSHGDWQQLGVKSSVTNFGNEYYFPAFRHPVKSIGALIFGLFFAGVGIGTGFMGAPILFPIIFGFFGALICFFGINMVLYKSKITVSSGQLSSQSGHFLLGAKQITLTGDIEDIVATSRSSHGNQRHYLIEIKRKNSKSLTIAKDLVIKADIESFIQKLKNELGIA